MLLLAPWATSDRARTKCSVAATSGPGEPTSRDGGHPASDTISRAVLASVTDQEDKVLILIAPRDHFHGDRAGPPAPAPQWPRGLVDVRESASRAIHRRPAFRRLLLTSIQLSLNLHAAAEILWGLVSVWGLEPIIVE